MHPVGPLNSKVYWIRRVSIVVLAVAVLVGMVWFLASRTSRSSAGQEQAGAVANTSAAPTLTGVLAASSGATRSTIPSPGPSPTGAPTAASTATAPVSSGAVVSDSAATTVDPAAAAAAAATAQAQADAQAQAAAAAAALAAVGGTTAAPPADPAATPTDPAAPPAPPAAPPAYDADGKLLCPDAAVAVLAISTAPSFAVGSNPTLGMTVTNTGTEACKRDVSGTLQTFTVLAADGSRVWSTVDCFPGEGTEVRELDPGQPVKYTVKWSGKTSAPGCTGDRAAVPAGDYTVVAQLGELVSQPVAFTMTG